MALELRGVTNMENLFKNKSEHIRIYIGKEIEIDPYEHTVDITMQNSQPIRAIVTDLVSSQITWKIPGIEISKAKEIIIKKKYENTLKASQKLKIRNEYYEGWRKNGKLQYRQEGDYLRAYVYLKKV